MREILGDEQYMVALHNGNAYRVVVLMKNIGAVARRFHQRSVGGIDIGRFCNVFRHCVEAQFGAPTRSCNSGSPGNWWERS